MDDIGDPVSEEVGAAAQAHISEEDPVTVIMAIIVTVETIGTVGGGVVIDMETMKGMGEGGGMETRGVQRVR